MENNKTIGFEPEKPNDNVNVNEKENNNDNDRSSLLIKIDLECKENGKKISDNKIKEFADSGIDPSWFDPPNSFIAFVSDYVDKSYKNKEQNEKTRLFISGILSWDSLREEYADFRTKGLENKEKNEEEAKLQQAINNKPTICQCGAKLDDLQRCLNCRGSYVFNNDERSYEFDSGATPEDMQKLKDMLKNGGQYVQI